VYRLLAFVAFAGTAFGQIDAVVGVGTFIHVVADLDKTMRFYGDDLGLQLSGAPGPRAFSANAVVEGLYDAKGSQSRVAVFKIPGSPLGVEFVEFKGIGQKAAAADIQDPGASILTLRVRDLGAVLSKLKSDGVPSIAEGLVKDPDGFFVQLVRQAEGESGAKLRLTVDSMDRTLHVFQDLLGFRPESGAPGSTYRISTAKVPGTDFEVEFIEYKGVHRQSLRPGIHDPGAGVLRLALRDVDSSLSRLKGAGVPVVSANGEPVTIGANRHFVILRDPDNFFFQLVPGPAAAPK
jgi:catechol 2,3-dioxygenase-like lactoylglutathione lyase family enzyme